MTTCAKQALRFIQSIDSSWKGHELFAMWIVKQMKPRIIVDLGFDRGLSTIAFAYKNKGQTFGIDWFGENYCQKSFAMDSAFRSIAAGIGLNYIKNINLIVGPFSEVSKKWDKEIDLLHIDWMHRYDDIKLQYNSWKKFLKKDAVILIHDVESHPGETGRFFRELNLPKLLFPHAKGLGIATRDTSLLDAISFYWKESLKWDEILQKSG